MKKISLILLAALLASSVSFSQTIKKVKITDVLKMADTATSPLVINFWATWCGPCVNELKWFEKTIAEYQNVNILLVSLDYGEDYPNAIAKFAKIKGYKAPIVWLNETDANMFCAKVDKRWQGTIPVTLMVNNAKGYREFYDHQLPEAQLKIALNKLVE
ncbi:MAG: TlpA disulfide reductase family protein [Flavobacterium sp.]|nr:TlpA disulfide reductase family protein [Flavobacterium sp.]MDI9366447.1 TlpA disulfide reductase family protein [Flavobacterium sp.]